MFKLTNVHVSGMKEIATIVVFLCLVKYWGTCELSFLCDFLFDFKIEGWVPITYSDIFLYLIFCVN